MTVLLTLFVFVLGLLIAKTLMNINLMVHILKKKDKELLNNEANLFH
ncbi:hypothetical protein [Leadbetterella sp. DM7]